MTNNISSDTIRKAFCPKGSKIVSSVDYHFGRHFKELTSHVFQMISLIIIEILTTQQFFTRKFHQTTQQLGKDREKEKSVKRNQNSLQADITMKLSTTYISLLESNYYVLPYGWTIQQIGRAFGTTTTLMLFWQGQSHRQWYQIGAMNT